MWRSRWAALGAAVAVASGSAGLSLVGAADPTDGSTYVSVVPCRLFDTRPAPDNVGTRDTPLGEGETHRQQVSGPVGDCNVPGAAVAVTINLTAVRGTARSYLTVAPAGEPRPTASTLNWVAGAPPTPNQVTVGLSSDGAIDLYNAFGEVDLVGDVVGYSTTAGLDTIGARLDDHQGRLDQLDLEAVSLSAEFNTLDDAVSQKADLDQVYTREVVNAMHTPIPVAGGVVAQSGGELPGTFSFGSWTATRTMTGTYQVDVTTRGGCNGLDYPFVQVTPIDPQIVSAAVPSCESLGWRFFVEVRDVGNANLVDGAWQFTMFA